MGSNTNRHGLESELLWLHEIGCTVRREGDGFFVENLSKPGPDFNFAEACRPKAWPHCIRVSTLQAELAGVHDRLARDRYFPQDGYDVNFAREGVTRRVGAGEHMEVALESWRGDRTARLSGESRLFHYVVNKAVVAWYSVLAAGGVCGVFDLEVASQWQGRGIGSDLLRSVPVGSCHFIQTWSSNTQAQRCYLDAGFSVSELLFRFAQTDKARSREPG